MNDHELQNALLMLHGGYIFPACVKSVRICELCRYPIDPRFNTCYDCQFSPKILQCAQGFMFYALKDRQSHWLMRQYKGQLAKSSKEHEAALTAIHAYLYLALKYHLGCLAKKDLPAFDAWTIVPSLREEGSYSTLDHPLHQLVSEVLSLCGFDLQHIEIVSQPTPETEQRCLDEKHFIVRSSYHPQHVLVIDDTWVSGGHIGSAVSCIKSFCEARISTLNIARYVDLTHARAQRLHAAITSRSIGNYHPIENCIWTLDGNCPTQ